MHAAWHGSIVEEEEEEEEEEEAEAEAGAGAGAGAGAAEEQDQEEKKKNQEEASGIIKGQENISNFTTTLGTSSAKLSHYLSCEK